MIHTIPDSALVIGTRNRGSLVKELIEELRSLDSLPKVIVIVDSSPDDFPFDDVSEALSSIEGVEFALIQSSPGAAYQKNVGLAYVRQHFRPEIIFLLDDDIRPSADYFKVCHELLQSEGVGLVGGFDIEQQPSPIGVLRSLIGLGSVKRGFYILRTGFTTYGRPTQRLEPCEWLPGGMVAFRDLKPAPQFSSDLLIYGDDVDFQIRNFANRGMFTSVRLAVRHLGAKAGKESRSWQITNYSVFRWGLAELTERVSKPWVVWGSLLNLTARVLTLWIDDSRSQALGELRFIGMLIMGRARAAQAPMPRFSRVMRASGFNG